MTARKAVDWETVEREFRAGQLSLRVIAKAAGITEGAVRKKAKVEGWQRDLTEKVRRAVRTEMVRAEVRAHQGPPPTEKEIVAGAASRTMEMLLTHRQDIAALRERRTKLMERYDAITKDDKVGTLKEVNEAATVLEAVSRIDGRIVTLERQAFNIDKDERDRPPGARPPVNLSKISDEQLDRLEEILGPLAVADGNPAGEGAAPGGAGPREGATRH